MADINIERKGNSMWPWLVGLVVLAIVAFFVMQYLNARNGGAADTSVNSTTTTVQTSTQ